MASDNTPGAPSLVDGGGRRVEYLRISVTDRCNLKCAYCMPAGGSHFTPDCDMVRFTDLLRLTRLFARLGVRKIRITGGEPLVRKGVTRFIHQAATIPGIERVALTTNGLSLGRMAAGLRKAGVTSVNISLDTLRRDRYATITGHDGLDNAMKGITSALEAGFDSVKINTVLMAGVNDDEIAAIARLTMTMPVQTRFIEFMPATAGVWNPSHFISAEEAKKRIEETFGPLAPVERERWSGPARIFRFPDAVGEVGFISSVSSHYCGACNRLRITSKGELLTCLFGAERLNLRALIMQGATDDDIIAAIRGALERKNHVRDFDAAGSRQVMSSIGG
ncbi:MAG: GTP 3',8-cyclase MoaA [Nitrospinae bacterium]|nr:GTP 3',8-cyclase MoaA [Nitrospinota bacterium]